MNKESLIAKYFSNNLTVDERIKFEHLLDTNQVFKDEVAFQKGVKLAATKKGHKELKRHFQDLENETGSTRNSSMWWLVAASIIVLVTCGFYFFNTDYTTDELFANNYEPAKNIVHPIVRDINATDAKTIAFIAYQKKDYKTAQHLFRSLYESTQDSEFLFYEAITLLEINNAGLAIQRLKSHKKNQDVLSPKTKWYLALAYLKNDNRNDAKLILNEIIKDKNAYKYKEAKKLLKKV